MLKAECPDCGEIVELRDGVQVGDHVTCGECGVLLEVLSLRPWELDYALDEDWDEDELDDLDDLDDLDSDEPDDE